MVLGSRMGPREFRRHPSLSNLRRAAGWPSHDPILSRNWVSGKPGTVHRLLQTLRMVTEGATANRRILTVSLLSHRRIVGGLTRG